MKYLKNESVLCSEIIIRILSKGFDIPMPRKNACAYFLLRSPYSWAAAFDKKQHLPLMTKNGFYAYFRSSKVCRIKTSHFYANFKLNVLQILIPTKYEVLYRAPAISIQYLNLHKQHGQYLLLVNTAMQPIFQHIRNGIMKGLCRLPQSEG